MQRIFYILISLLCVGINLHAASGSQRARITMAPNYLAAFPDAPKCQFVPAVQTVQSQNYQCLDPYTGESVICSYPQGNGAFSQITTDGHGYRITSLTIAGIGPVNPGSFVPLQIAYGQATQTFTATVTGPGGSSTCTATVSVACYSAPPIEVNDGGTRCYITGAPPGCEWTCCDKESNECKFRGNAAGCFHPEVQVLLADGSTKQARNVKKGDLLWNPRRAKGSPVTKVIIGEEKLPLIEFNLADAQSRVPLRVTTLHPMITLVGMKAAKDVHESDWLLGDDGKLYKISSKRNLPLEKGQVVFNFEINSGSTREEDHMIVANGLVTGDYYLQTKLFLQATP